MDELQHEQQHLDRLHQVLELRRERLLAELAQQLRERPGTAQGHVERSAAARRLRRLVATYEAAEHGLCFGRLDLAGGERRYLGRVGLRDADADPDADPLLIDWRAPAARPFYTATAAAPQGVRLRRHLHTRGRKLVRVDDEVLDQAALEQAPARDVELTGEAALLESLRTGRTGRMRDVIATLQAEQDRIIRSAHTGVLVVQGGPGTGKTVVALHRAAYLLYTHPGLNERGVLVVGPNPVFLGYISQVLPGLGESSALLATLGELLPGLDARGSEPGEVAELKGRPVLADVVAAAVRARQAAADGPVEIVVDGDRLVLTRRFLADAADDARGTGRPHNLARPRFHRTVLEELARQLAGVVAGLEDQLEADLARYVDTAGFDRAAGSDLSTVFGDESEPVDTDELEADEFETARRNWLGALPNDRGVQRLLTRLWPRLTPQRLICELFAEPDRLDAVAPQLSVAERALLRRPADGPWTPADVPLLDEAAELLGHDDALARRQAERERQERVDYAQGVLDIAFGSRSQEADDLSAAQMLRVTDVIDAEQFAQWQQEADLRTVAERAAADRTWAFGHVIVDEAQELSPMAWRLLLRRCPSRSFTVVGDMAQASEAVGASSWAQALAPAFGDRWRLESLTVNYRTPVEVMAASEPVREAIHPDLPPARAVRDGGDAPWRERPADLPARLGRLAAEEAAAAGDGRVAVIVPQQRLGELAAAVLAEVPDASWGEDPDLERAVVVLGPRQAKGLEFDVVLLADPDGVLAGSPRGLNDLFVALTRATRRLGVLHGGPVPALLAGIGTERPALH